MELFWFAIALVLSCFIETECLSSINTVPNIAHEHEANLENIGMKQSQVPESLTICNKNELLFGGQNLVKWSIKYTGYCTRRLGDVQSLIY